MIMQQFGGHKKKFMGWDEWFIEIISDEVFISIVTFLDHPVYTFSQSISIFGLSIELLSPSYVITYYFGEFES